MQYLLMAQPEGGSSGGGMFSMLIMFAVIFVVFYFFMIRPQQKKQKEHQAMVSALKKGDKVVTNSGMFGVVWGIDDTKVVLKFGEDLKIEFLKSSIAGKVD